MREIKFRAWNTREQFIDTAWLIDWEHEKICHSKHNQSKLDDCILMQYVGLKDKNGKEIYEGDIIKLGTEERFYVAWHDYKQEFTFRGYDGGYYPNTYRGATRDDEYGWEVIGNIYENKELLTA
ncbi:YopX family protein [Priestia flexa]|uniref:YopX family protein n=1 Tax=Priestia flexa TaxID=86664 RepID=UPI003CFD5626